MTIRGAFYFIARLMGDVNAARRGKVGQRIARRGIGRILGKLLGGLFRGGR